MNQGKVKIEEICIGNPKYLSFGRVSSSHENGYKSNEPDSLHSLGKTHNWNQTRGYRIPMHKFPW